MAGEPDLAAVGGWDVDVDHLHGGEFLEHAARRQPGGESAQPSGERDVQAIRQEGDEDVGFDTTFQLMEDPPDGEIALEVAEGLLDVDELEIVAPQSGGIVVVEIGAQQIAALASSRLTQLVAIEAITEGRGFLVDVDDDETPGGYGRARARRRASSEAPGVRASWRKAP